MKKLIRGIVEFRKKVRPACKENFAELALGQHPDALLIACSDSRVAPNVFASLDPGDLFVVRNIGNFVPPWDGPESVASYSHIGAAIEYSLLKLPVMQIIVCGHSECGAMSALLKGRSKIDAAQLRHWLRHGDESLGKLKNPDGKAKLERHNHLSQINVLQQLEHLKTYPLVKQRMAEGRLTLHGWWFDIREADVYEYDAEEKGFRLIDETFAQVLLERALN
jgi:carbonic anhydrase